MISPRIWKAYENLFPLQIFLAVMVHQFESVGCFIVSVLIRSGREQNCQLKIAFWKYRNRMIIRMCSLRIQNFDLTCWVWHWEYNSVGSSMEGKVYEKGTLSPLLHSSPGLGWSVIVNKTSSVTGNGFSLWSSWSWHVRWKQKSFMQPSG